MNYNSLVDSLRQATLFDLYRLSRAIQDLMSDTERQEAIKASVCLGQRVQYFHARENREVTGYVLKMKRAAVLIKSEHDHQVWSVPYYALNLQSVDTTLQTPPRRATLDRSLLKVGDHVGFKDRHQDVYGVVIKLNSKTAKVKLPAGIIWHVYYEHLFAVMDGEYSSTNPDERFITGEVVESTVG